MGARSQAGCGFEALAASSSRKSWLLRNRNRLGCSRCDAPPIIKVTTTEGAIDDSFPITADRPDGPNIFSTEHAVVAPVSDPHLAVPVAGRPTVAFPTTAFEAWTTGANAEAGAPSSRARSGQTPVFLRVYGGLGSTAGVTGVGLARGVAARPFRRQNMEVEGDLSVFHYSNRVFGAGTTSNVVEFTGDFLYNFELSGQKLVPFAGGGLVLGHGSAEENNFFREGLSLGSGGAAGVDLTGGVQLPLSGHTAFRAELHVHGYAGGSAVIVLGGLSFRLN